MTLEIHFWYIKNKKISDLLFLKVPYDHTFLEPESVEQ